MRIIHSKTYEDINIFTEQYTQAHACNKAQTLALVTQMLFYHTYS